MRVKCKNKVPLTKPSSKHAKFLYLLFLKIIVFKLYILYFRASSIVFIAVGLLATVQMLTGPLFYEIGEQALPLTDWHLLNITSPLRFWITYLQQGVFLALCGGTIGATHDTLVAGLMLQICNQSELLCLRLRKLPYLNEKLHYETLIKCVHQHNSIFRWFIH